MMHDVRCATGKPLNHKITAEFFRECVGRDPQDDDLDRCNCPGAGIIGHYSCGWNISARKPQFMCGLNDTVTGGNLVWSADRFAPAGQPHRPCFVCGQQTDGEVCGPCQAGHCTCTPEQPQWCGYCTGAGQDRQAPVAACVPDDQPTQDYAARREEIARRRNPERPVFIGVDWGCVPSHTVYAATDGNGWYTIAYPGDWQPDGPNTEGIGRAVARINAPYEPRCGLWRED